MGLFRTLWAPFIECLLGARLGWCLPHFNCLVDVLKQLVSWGTRFEKKIAVFYGFLEDVADPLKRGRGPLACGPLLIKVFGSCV